MKANIFYKLGTIIMCLVVVWEIIACYNVHVVLADFDYLFSLYYLFVPPSVSIVGLVLYIKKEEWGWIICCSNYVSLFVVEIISYFVLSQLSISLGDVQPPFIFIVKLLFFVLVICLLLTRQMRSVFFYPKYTTSSELIISLIATTLAIIILWFLPIILRLDLIDVDYFMKSMLIPLVAILLIRFVVWVRS